MVSPSVSSLTSELACRHLRLFCRDAASGREAHIRRADCGGSATAQAGRPRPSLPAPAQNVGVAFPLPSTLAFRYSEFATSRWVSRQVPWRS